MNNKPQNTKLWAWLNLSFYALTLVVNFMGANGTINGMSQKDVSDKYPTLITPAPFTFSIWGLIYVLVLATSIYLIVREKSTAVKRLITLISPLFWLSCLFNIAWIVIFSYEWLGLSVILIFGYLLSIILINRRIVDQRREIPFRLASIAFSVYAGWLTIATVVNIASFLVQIQWNRFGLDDSIWTVMTIIAAMAIVWGINTRLRSACYPLPVAWAFFGIVMTHPNLKGMVLGSAVPIILYLGIACLVVMAIAQFIHNRQCVLPKEKE